MNKTRQKSNSTKSSKPKFVMSKGMNFFLTFLLGLAMAIGFAILVGSTDGRIVCTTTTTLEGEIIKECIRPVIKELSTLFDTTYLSLTIAGTLGGLLYSMLLDKTLELPSWNKEGNGLKPGFLGDIFVGIAGAFIASAFLPEAYTDAGSKTFVTGLVGGYGGKYILDAALQRVIKQIEEGKNAKIEVSILEEKVNLFSLVILRTA